MTESETIPIERTFGDEEIDVIYKRSPDPQPSKDWPLDGCGCFPPLDPRSYEMDGIQRPGRPG
jgi:hypothetical protein